MRSTLENVRVSLGFWGSGLTLLALSLAVQELQHRAGAGRTCNVGAEPQSGYLTSWSYHNLKSLSNYNVTCYEGLL